MRHGRRGVGDESQAATGDVWRSCDVCEDVYALASCKVDPTHPTHPDRRQPRQPERPDRPDITRQALTAPDSHADSTRQHPTAPTRSSPLKKTESTPERHRPMPEDADQDILERLVCLWPTMRSNRGPTELSSHAKVEELSWCLGWKYSFWQSFRKFSVQVKELFESLQRPESN